MILKGSQRGGGAQLAAHLMRLDENDHVTLHEVRGFVSEDVDGALSEAHAISKATQCKQFMFSLSLNPPKGAVCSIEDMVEAANRAETALGLQNQPRLIVVHEKEGRRHIHAVWSRIDVTEMKAVALPFFKNRLAALSKELYLHHEWELPDGHRENGWKNPLNFTLAEWQQAKRLGLDPREVKLLFADAWKHSDGLKSFKAALEDRGYFLAAGDRRGFVALDVNGEIFSVARLVGVKTKDLEARLGSPSNLPGVARVSDEIALRLSAEAKAKLKDLRERQREELRPVAQERQRMVDAQREERQRLQVLQDARLRRETMERQRRFSKGVRGLWEVLTGRAAEIRRDNEHAAFMGYRRDVDQRETLFAQQLEERRNLHERTTALRRLHRVQLRSVVEHVTGLTADRGSDARPHAPGRELTFIP